MMSNKTQRNNALVAMISVWGGQILVHRSSLLIAQPCTHYVDVIIGVLIFFGIWKVCNLVQAFYRWFNGIEKVSSHPE
jgi:hypothetical protein